MKSHYIPSKKEIDDLKQICTPLEITEHPDNLASLKHIVGNATIVGLGEQTQGTREFFKMKQCILSYLVNYLGFNLFAIKANMSVCKEINDYIHSGNGDIKELIQHFYGGNSQEVFDLIEWMRKHNKTAKTKLHFSGFDFQNPLSASKLIQANLATAGDKGATDIINKILVDYMEIKKIVEDNILSDEELQSMQTSDKYQQLLANITLLTEHITKFKSKMPAANYSWLKQHVNLLKQAAHYLLDFKIGHNAMIENIQWLQSQHPDAKIILWAHNHHIQKHDDHLSLGQLLIKHLGTKYCAIGLTTYTGTYSAYSTHSKCQHHNLEIPVPSPHSLETNLHRLEMPVALINLRNPDKVPAFLKVSVAVQVLTSIAETRSFRWQNVSESFDAIIFIAKTSSLQHFRDPANDAVMPKKTRRKAAR